ncbi:MAG TPA: metalloregulator ArsR/SmtB family transcription factor [Thermoanaerobaculia bacterium]
MSVRRQRKLQQEPLSDQAIELVAARFRILGEPIRIKILQELQDGEKNVTELVAAVGSTQPNVSKHLRILQEAGMVCRKQLGNNVYCSVSDPTVFELCEVVCGSIADRMLDLSRTLAELDKRR